MATCWNRVDVRSFLPFPAFLHAFNRLSVRLFICYPLFVRSFIPSFHSNFIPFLTFLFGIKIWGKLLPSDSSSARSCLDGILSGFGGTIQGLNLFWKAIRPKGERSGHVNIIDRYCEEEASQIDLLLTSYQFQLNWNQQKWFQIKCLFLWHLPQLPKNIQKLRSCSRTIEPRSMVSVSALAVVPRNALKMQTSQHVQIVQCLTKKFHLQAESSKLPTRYLYFLVLKTLAKS